MQVVCMVKCLHLCNHYRITTSCLKSTPKLSAYYKSFYAWVRRLRKETCHTIPDPGRHHADNGICVNEVVKVEILPEEQQDPSDAKDNPVSLPTAGVPMITIPEKS